MSEEPMSPTPTIDTWIDRHAATDRIAFRFEGQAITYAELAQRIAATANALQERGVTDGDRIVYLGLNQPEIFELLFACGRLGAVLVPLNNRLVEAELATQIHDSDPVLMVGADGFAATLTALAEGRPVVDLDAAPFRTPSDDGHSVTAPRSAVDPESTVLMVYTSGTTGTPKGAMLSQRALLATVRHGVAHQDLTATDRVIAPLPTFHVGGLNIQTLPTLFVGGEVLLLRRFDPDAVLDLVEDFQPTQALLVPAMLAAIAASPRFAGTDIERLDGICTGSSVIPLALIEPYLERGVPVGQVYGATETGPTTVVLRYDEVAERPTSCGRPCPGTELRIVDAEGRDVPAGTAGELWVRGDNLFSGYWGNPAATAAAFSDGWYRTGDVGHLDTEGYCYISDRLKDLIISGGENVYPAELEAVLLDHPAIEEIAVIAREDERWGEVANAVVVLADGHSLSLDGLRDWCTDRLAKFKHPRHLQVVAELPRTALGKVQKHELRGQLGSQ